MLPSIHQSPSTVVQKINISRFSIYSSNTPQGIHESQIQVMVAFLDNNTATKERPSWLELQHQGKLLS